MSRAALDPARVLGECRELSEELFVSLRNGQASVRGVVQRLVDTDQKLHRSVEGVLRDRDKRSGAMHSSTQRLESTKQLLEPSSNVA